MSNSTELSVPTKEATDTPKSGDNGRTNESRTRLVPVVDIVEDSHGITLYADLPGVPRDKLDIRVQDGNLTLEAEAIVPMPAGLRLHHGEIRNPHYARAFALSSDFDVTRIDAQLRDGVLKLTIPRRDEAKPRRIEVIAG
ncbi:MULTISPECIES: Hsp20/alpha crystallin family protein [unclassified Burkholderia]|uniref:Hsp20/alpha crystallin family protein n=1 Tax=unclassified Burkholderia TaxID=2613784 RepID=UPI00142424D5|nr:MULTISPECIES: Hsp20/alpha crystallin family protein [unclassified Burkholderia]NIE82391.1 Hsp20/alpha crystallin family protein [Burkholderia sp. Tr-860]NIF61282.1 Hsp20/alpha crystallin family protein [Burkholderia sp. Cy-647]NIF96199.1 Hsp20/alpha crystallin family protein [Burkholderia sp. Ax-1720]